MLSPEHLDGEISAGIQDKVASSLEDGELEEGTAVPTPPAKRRKCGRESLLDRALDETIPKEIVCRSTNIVWVDLEMTGLLETDTIMEMACIVTDKHLNILEEGPSLVIHHSDKALEDMGEWCTLQHGKTGLTRQCKESKLTCEEVEDQMIEFVKKYCPKGRCELAGNSIHTDRRFLMKEMPRFLEWLHYRIIDVSSIGNVAWRWYPDFEKYHSDQPISHRALDDIRSSIAQLQFYRETVFKSRQQYTADLGSSNTQQVPVDALFQQYNVLRYKMQQAAEQKRNMTDTEKLAADENGKQQQPPVENVQKPVCVTVRGEEITLFGTK